MLVPRLIVAGADVPHVWQQNQLPEGFLLMTECPCLPGGHVMDEHLAASRTPELLLSACTPLMLAGFCLAVQSFH